MTAEQAAIQELQQLETEFAQAMVNRDIAFLERVLSDEVIYTNFIGNRVTKAQDLAPFYSGDLTITSYEADDLLIHPYGSIAIVNLRIKVAGNFSGEAFSGLYRFTRIYQKQDDQWQVIAAQSTTIAGSVQDVWNDS